LRDFHTKVPLSYPSKCKQIHFRSNTCPRKTRKKSFHHGSVQVHDGVVSQEVERCNALLAEDQVLAIPSTGQGSSCSEVNSARQGSPFGVQKQAGNFPRNCQWMKLEIGNFEKIVFENRVISLASYGKSKMFVDGHLEHKCSFPKISLPLEFIENHYFLVILILISIFDFVFSRF
jgi:hypothetical protein